MNMDAQVIDSNLTWLRKKETEDFGNVWMKHNLTGKEYVMLKHVDHAPVFLD